MRRRLRYGLSAVAGTALAAGVLALPAAAHPAPQASSLAVTGSVPAWATPGATAGSVSSTQQIHISVALALRDQAGATRFAAAVSDPSNAQYGHFLTPAAFRAQYYPTAAQAKAVANWMSAKGLHAAVGEYNRTVEATASAGALQSAFGTTLRTFHVGTQVLRAPASAVKLPASIARSVVDVGGLAQIPLRSFTARTMTHRSPALNGGAPARQGGYGLNPRGQAAPNSANNQNCSHYYNENLYTGVPKKYTIETNYICGYVGSQINKMYGMGTSTASNGTGQTIAIVDAYKSATQPADANRYFAGHGVAPFTPGQYTDGSFAPMVTNQCQAPSAWAGEEALDIEAAHTLAPGAKQYYVGAANCLDANLQAAVTKAANNANVSIISNSYGGPESQESLTSLRSWNNVLVQAAAQGQSVFFSSGDSGDFTDNGLSSPTSSFPATSPWVTAVGGTSVLETNTGTLAAETGWESNAYVYSGGGYQDFGFQGGAGGGPSHTQTEPSWQKNVVPAQYTGGGHRATPDIGALADPYTGFLIGYNPGDGSGYAESDIGGTSLASPLLAAATADAQQVQRKRLGLLTPAIYTRYRTALRDVKHVASGEYFPAADSQGNPLNAVIGNDVKSQTLQAAVGYDNVTGMGSPNGAAWLTGI